MGGPRFAIVLLILGVLALFHRPGVSGLGSSSDTTELGSLRQTTSLFWASVSSLVKLWG